MKLHPITTVIAVNAVHATAMDEIVASAVESAPIAKLKVFHKSP
jgi:hypothetical protein